jgi:hypothetical protein
MKVVLIDFIIDSCIIKNLIKQAFYYCYIYYSKNEFIDLDRLINPTLFHSSPYFLIQQVAFNFIKIIGVCLNIIAKILTAVDFFDGI